jgi:hypothetical protein
MDLTKHVPPNSSREEDPIPETLHLFEYWKMDKVQKPGNPECYIPSSQSFR